MARTGRKPFETTDIVPFGADSRRLQPPDCLGVLQRKAFVDLITNVPRGQFRPADLTLLCRWSELTVMTEQAAFELQQGGMVIADDKGRTRVNPWFAIYRDASKELRVLSQRLRLDPKARGQKKAPKTLPGPVSYYERMDMEGDWDDSN
jgi:phage terminase small subunit